MIQITRSGVRDWRTPRVMERLSEEFARRRWVRFPALFEPYLLRKAVDRIATGSFESVAGQSLQYLVGDDLRRWLCFFLDDPLVLDTVSMISGAAVRGVQGHVHRIRPGTNDHLHWHTDVLPGNPRLVAITLNLSPSPYSGGLLRLRACAKPRKAREVPNHRLGDAVIFAVDPALEHSNSAVRGERPKISFAGWFHAEPVPRIPARSR